MKWLMKSSTDTDVYHIGVGAILIVIISLNIYIFECSQTSGPVQEIMDESGAGAGMMREKYNGATRI